jgi:O-antigen/teichoic acid export membrane protein
LRSKLVLKSPIATVARWLREPSVQVAALFASAGIGFAGANLLLARALTPSQYGLVALWLTLYNLGGALAPWGADGVVNRRPVPPDRRFVRRTIVSSTVTAAVTATVSGILYPFETSHLLILGVGIIICGMATMAAAQFQARQNFFAAMVIWQGSNIVLLLAAVGSLAWPGTGVLLPMEIFTAGAMVIAAFGWRRLRSMVRPVDDAVGKHPSEEAYSWREALSYYLAASATAFLPQIERLVIPEVLSLEDLALYGVLAALALSPFRMLSSGVGYTLFPRMGKASCRRERRELLRMEIRTMSIAVALAVVGVWYLAPWVTDVFLGDKYELTSALLVAGLIAGCSRVLGALARALVSALGSNADLAVYGAASWVALVAAGAGAAFGARWGVPGVIYGATAGLSVRWLLAFGLSARYLVGADPD